MESGDCRVTPEFNTNQCIFYPVKEEEREVLLGAAQINNGNLTTGTSSDTLQIGHQATDTNLSKLLFPVILFCYERLQEVIYFNVKSVSSR